MSALDELVAEADKRATAATDALRTAAHTLDPVIDLTGIAQVHATLAVAAEVRALRLALTTSTTGGPR